MPTLLEETEIRIEFSDLSRRSRINHSVDPTGRIINPTRAKGIHLSGVLRHCALACKFLKPGEPLEEEMPWRMAVGVAMEEFLASLYPEMDWQPGEMEKSGVYMNLDGLSLLDLSRSNNRQVGTTLCVEEFKCTWKKRRVGEEIFNEWLWQHQIRAECARVEALYGRLHVMYINGDYRPSAPVYVRYLFRFTEKEVANTWRMVEANKHKAVQE